MLHKQLAAVIGAGILLAACSHQSTTPRSTPSVDQAKEQAQEKVQEAMDNAPKTVVLSEQNQLGQSGVAILTATEDGKTKVQLNMAGGKFTEPQPAHIHVGSCPSPGAVKYPLTNVGSDGKSETILNVSLKSIKDSGEAMAINVHKSAKEAQVYTACGDFR